MDEGERIRIRLALFDYMAEHKCKATVLHRRIAKSTNVKISLSTLQRFLADRVDTRDEDFLDACKRFVARGGDAMADLGYALHRSLGVFGPSVSLGSVYRNQQKESESTMTIVAEKSFWRLTHRLAVPIRRVMDGVMVQTGSRFYALMRVRAFDTAVAYRLTFTAQHVEIDGFENGATTAIRLNKHA